jgi:hypothetical protein
VLQEARDHEGSSGVVGTLLNNNGACGHSNCYPCAGCTLTFNLNMTLDCSYLDFVLLCLFSLELRPTI